MANLRAGVVVFNSEATNDIGVSSKVANPGPATNVAIFARHKSGDGVTVKIQCAGGKPAAGLNAVPTEDDDWYDYYQRDASAPETIVLSGGSSICLDLSPFAPPYVRLHAINAMGESSVISATVLSNGG